MTELNEMFKDEVKEILRDINNWSELSEDEPICALCKERVIDDVPLRMWTEDGKLEISFHIECAFRDEVDV